MTIGRAEADQAGARPQHRCAGTRRDIRRHATFFRGELFRPDLERCSQNAGTPETLRRQPFADTPSPSREQLCKLLSEGLVISDRIAGIRFQPKFAPVNRPESKIQRLHPRKLPDEFTYCDQPFFIGFLHGDVDGQGLDGFPARDRSNLVRHQADTLFALIHFTGNGHDFSFIDLFGRLREHLIPDHDFHRSGKIFNGQDRERLPILAGMFLVERGDRAGDLDCDLVLLIG